MRSWHLEDAQSGDGDGRPTPRSCSPWSRRARCSPRPGGAGPCCTDPRLQREDTRGRPDTRADICHVILDLWTTHLLCSHQIYRQHLVHAAHSGRIYLVRKLNAMILNTHFEENASSRQLDNVLGSYTWQYCIAPDMRNCLNITLFWHASPVATPVPASRTDCK